MMIHAWNGYKTHAWGSDELNPISKTAFNWSGSHSFLMTPVDALDTLYIMNLKPQFKEAKNLIIEKLDFDVNADINVFETIIRILGGLLSAYDLTGDKKLLEKAKDLADRIMPVFNTLHGIPENHINLKTGEVFSVYSANLAEIGTMQLEFQYLSDVIGDQKYAEKALMIIDQLHVLMKNNSVKLYPKFISTVELKFLGNNVGIAAGSDSFYEYLLKMWLATGSQKYRDYYFETAESIVSDLSKTSHEGYISFPDKNGLLQMETFEHLSCFAGGMLALGAIQYRNGNWSRQLDSGVRFTETCYKSYERSSTGLGGEKVFLETLLPIEESYFLRPEVIESIFYMWRITHDPKYREWGWNIAQSIESKCRNEVGYHGLHSAIEPSDRMESFFLAETLKYLYLLFSSDDLIPLEKYVFNTEAHPLSIRGYGRRKKFSRMIALETSMPFKTTNQDIDRNDKLMEMVINGALSN